MTRRIAILPNILGKWLRVRAVREEEGCGMRKVSRLSWFENRMAQGMGILLPRSDRIVTESLIFSKLIHRHRLQQVPDRQDPDDRAALQDAQIGRASCRERV